MSPDGTLQALFGVRREQDGSSSYKAEGLGEWDVMREDYEKWLRPETNFRAGLYRHLAGDDTQS